MNVEKREYFIDWLRVLVVALLVPHHAAITFSHLGDTYVYTPIRDRSLYFFIQSTFLNLWFMRMLFFISGISTYYALLKRSHHAYLRERGQRLLIPALFAIFCICPLTGYILALKSYGFQETFLAFYPEFFQKFEKFLGWGHTWFLVYLFTYSVILLAIRIIFRQHTACLEKFSTFLAAKQNIILPMLIIILFEMLFRPFFPGHQNLYADWANFSVYLTFFLLGYLIAGKQEWFEAITDNQRGFMMMSCIAGGTFLFLKYARENLGWFIVHSQRFSYGYALGLALLQGVAEYALVMLLVGIARQRLNRNSPWLVYLSRTSFALYLFHYLILSCLLYFLIKLSINHYVLYSVAIVLTYLGFALVFELGIKKIPILRYVCGVKRTPLKPQFKPRNNYRDY